jgi:hypothetical protein
MYVKHQKSIIGNVEAISLSQTPLTQLPRSAGYTPCVASPPIHPSGKHFQSTTSNISIPHDTDSSQDYTFIYCHSDHYTKYLVIYLLVCMFPCSYCIVITAFVPYREGHFCKSTLDSGARRQFHKLSPFRRLKQQQAH